MKNTHIWAIVAILLGFSAFGIFKSVELSVRNAGLNKSMRALERELVLTQKSLATTRNVLGESYLKNAELEGRLIAMDAKVAVQARDIKAHIAKINALSSKLQETARANAFFSARNKEIAHELLAEKLDADEMRRKLSSVVELKKAIKELRVKVKSAIKSDRSEAKKAIVAQPERKEPLNFEPQKPLESVEGNEGYVIKEGRSTYTGWVDVSVVTSGPVIISQEERTI
jgi:septal ring factor EnvC (AmiA/AmiB activator)